MLDLLSSFAVLGIKIIFIGIIFSILMNKKKYNYHSPWVVLLFFIIIYLFYLVQYWLKTDHSPNDDITLFILFYSLAFLYVLYIIFWVIIRYVKTNKIAAIKKDEKVTILNEKRKLKYYIYTWATYLILSTIIYMMFLWNEIFIYSLPLSLHFLLWFLFPLLTNEYEVWIMGGMIIEILWFILIIYSFIQILQWPSLKKRTIYIIILSLIFLIWHERMRDIEYDRCEQLASEIDKNKCIDRVFYGFEMSTDSEKSPFTEVYYPETNN